MAAYFLISVLAIVLVPLTLGAAARVSASESLLPSSEPHTDHPTERPEERVRGCQCTPCLDRRKQVLAKSIFNPRLTTRSVFFTVLPTHRSRFRSRTAVLLIGWSVVAFLVSRVRNAESDNKVYDPYEILGISAVRAVSPARRMALIRSPRVPRRRKSSPFSRSFPKSSTYHRVCWARSDHVSSHPDKVKATVNDTVEQIANRFVEITKAYKS